MILYQHLFTYIGNAANTYNNVSLHCLLNMENENYIIIAYTAKLSHSPCFIIKGLFALIMMCANVII